MRRRQLESSYVYRHMFTQIFEWWYFRKYGTSFIEQVSLNHISPWLGGGDGETANGSPNGSPTQPALGKRRDLLMPVCQRFPNNQIAFSISECKVWRNPLSLFRGAEYNRFYQVTSKEPLTYYDMNLSAQDHQTFFTCEADTGKPEYESN